MNHARTAPDFQGFSEELRHYWRMIPHKSLFFPVLIAWLLLFQFLGNSTFGYIDTPSLFGWMFNAYNAESEIADDSHGNLIPLAVLALLWWKRSQLAEVATRNWWPGLLLVAGSLAVHLLGYLIQQPRLSVIALFGGIYGLIGLAWGPRMMLATFFPMFLFGFMVPLGSLTEAITFPLRLLVTHIVEFISTDVLGLNVLHAGTKLIKPPTMDDPGFEYEVAAACGGIRSLIAITAIAIVYGFTGFTSFWKRGVLIASALPLAVVGNTFRLFVVVMVSEIFGREAGLWVHDNTVLNLLPYIPAIVGLIYLGRWLEGPRSDLNPPTSGTGDNAGPGGGSPGEPLRPSSPASAAQAPQPLGT